MGDHEPGKSSEPKEPSFHDFNPFGPAKPEPPPKPEPSPWGAPAPRPEPKPEPSAWEPTPHPAPEPSHVGPAAPAEPAGRPPPAPPRERPEHEENVFDDEEMDDPDWYRDNEARVPCFKFAETGLYNLSGLKNFGGDWTTSGSGGEISFNFCYYVNKAGCAPDDSESFAK